MGRRVAAGRTGGNDGKFGAGRRCWCHEMSADEVGADGLTQGWGLDDFAEEADWRGAVGQHAVVDRAGCLARGRAQLGG